MAVTDIRSVTVPVADQDAALDFYTRALGFEVRSDNPFPMGRWLTVAPAGTTTTLLLASWFPEMAPVGGMVLISPDVAALAKPLAEHDTAFEGPTDEPWGRQLLFHDPFGNGYAVIQA